MIIFDFNCNGRSSIPANLCEIGMPEILTSPSTLLMIGLTTRDSGSHALSRPSKWHLPV
jgi:hypothetical protein